MALNFVKKLSGIWPSTKQGYKPVRPKSKLTKEEWLDILATPREELFKEPFTYDPLDWRLQIVRFNAYNETSFALVKGLEDKHYIFITPSYPYGKPSMILSKRSEHQKAHFLPYWSHVFDEAEDINSLEQDLYALPAIECITDNPREELDEIFERHRFHSRNEIATTYTQDHAIQKRFERVDFARRKLYQAEYYLHHLHTGLDYVYLNQKQTEELINKICKEYGVPYPQDVRLRTHESFKKEGSCRKDGQLNLKFHKHANGVRLATVIHEMAHYVNLYFVMDGTLPPSGHGYQFRKILLNMLHNFTGIDAQTLADNANQHNFYLPFQITADEIINRDFTERRSIDYETPELAQELKEPYQDPFMIHETDKSSYKDVLFKSKRSQEYKPQEL